MKYTRAQLTFTLATILSLNTLNATPDVPLEMSEATVVLTTTPPKSRFSHHFKGFSTQSGMDFQSLRKTTGAKAFMAKPNSDLILPLVQDLDYKIQEMMEAYPQLAGTAVQIDRLRLDPALLTPYHYFGLLAHAALSLSKKSNEEESFLRLAGFPVPYGLVEGFKPTQSADSVALALFSSNSPSYQGAYSAYYTKGFRDPAKKMKAVFSTNIFKSTPHFFITQNPGESELGLYYLATMYAQGIHPIPVALDPNDDKLHGLNLPPWGEVCHDLAHSEADRADFSMRQFAYHIMNAYSVHIAMLGEKEARDLPWASDILEPVAHYAKAIHTAYRQGVLDIVNDAQEHFGVSAKTTKLSAEFEAFSAAAFLMLHEEPRSLDHAYAYAGIRGGFVKILEADVNGLEGLNNSNPDFLVPGNFDTSFAHGTCLMSEAELEHMVRQLPLSDFLLDFPPADDTVVLGEGPRLHSIVRNKMYVELRFEHTNGYIYTYREATNYARQINFDHDMSILKPAAKILETKYNFTLPQRPTIGEEGYEAKAADFSAALYMAKDHLRAYFLEAAKDIASKGITVRFYQNVLRAEKTLKTVLPEFAREDFQGFLRKATSISAPEGEALADSKVPTVVEKHKRNLAIEQMHTDDALERSQQNRLAESDDTLEHDGSASASTQLWHDAIRETPALLQAISLFNTNKIERQKFINTALPYLYEEEKRKTFVTLLKTYISKPLVKAPRYLPTNSPLETLHAQREDLANLMAELTKMPHHKFVNTFDKVAHYFEKISRTEIRQWVASKNNTRVARQEILADVEALKVGVKSQIQGTNPSLLEANLQDPEMESLLTFWSVLTADRDARGARDPKEIEVKLNTFLQKGESRAALKSLLNIYVTDSCLKSYGEFGSVDTALWVYTNFFDALSQMCPEQLIAAQKVLVKIEDKFYKQGRLYFGNALIQSLWALGPIDAEKMLSVVDNVLALPIERFEVPDAIKATRSLSEQQWKECAAIVQKFPRNGPEAATCEDSLDDIVYFILYAGENKPTQYAPGALRQPIDRFRI